MSIWGTPAAAGGGADRYVVRPGVVDLIKSAAKAGANAPSPYIYLGSNPATGTYADISAGDGTVACWQVGNSSISDAGICFAKKIPASANRLVLEGSVTNVSSSWGAIEINALSGFSLTGNPWYPQGVVAHRGIVRQTPSSLPYQQFALDLSGVSADCYAYIYIVYAVLHVCGIWYE